MLQDYFPKSKSLFYSLLITLPLFLMYEIGIFFMFQTGLSFVKNGGDVLIEEFIKMLGLNGYYAASSIFIAVLFFILISQRKNFKTFEIKYNYLFFMVIESLVYAYLLLLLLQNIYLFQGIDINWLSNFILSIGAGLYEELIFRFLLIFILTKSISFIFKTKEFYSLILSIVASSILFSIFHYIGEESFTPISFTLRFLAGIYLSVIYVNRGFGIVALTHAFYDLFVIFRLT
ncbi:MAG: CPBP family intramembrane glutamic endopeptidase [Candidatus Neomarinimicrobiota bacterium]